MPVVEVGGCAVVVAFVLRAAKGHQDDEAEKLLVRGENTLQSKARRCGSSPKLREEDEEAAKFDLEVSLAAADACAELRVLVDLP